MKIELPFPDMSKLNAHSKGNSHFAKSAATKNARALAKFTCVDMLNRKEIKPIDGPVLISYAFFVPDNRDRDVCNMLQACKPFIDGIVDASIVEGDSWRMMAVYNISVEIDKKHPRVELRINSTSGVGDLMATKTITRV